MIWVRALTGFAGFALAVAIAGCGQGDGGRFTIVTSTGVARSIVEQLAGDDAEVVQLVPDTASPHSYAPSIREQATLADADLVVYFGERFDGNLPLEAAERSFAIDEHVGRLVDGDPHVWMDPTRIEAALPALAGELAGLDPANAGGYRSRADELGGSLMLLDRRIEAIVARIPAGRRRLVTSHDALGYYARRYGFRVVGSVFGTSPEAQASPRELVDLLREVIDSGIPVVFAQQGDDAAVLDRFEDFGVSVVDDLLVETLGGEVDSYQQMLLVTSRRIAAGLRG